MEVASLDIPLTLIALLASSALLIPALDVGLGRQRTAKFSGYFTIATLLFALIIVSIAALGVVPLDTSVPNIVRNDLLGIFFSVGLGDA